MNILLTGGCGFIGSNLVRHLRQHRPAWKIVNLDKLTYAGNLESLRDLEGDPGHVFVRGDVANRELVDLLLREHRITAILHLAAESHVDRSILGPEVFIHTNVLGTQMLLESARAAGISRFVMVSTDEVYGSLGPTGAFSETSPLKPSSPYSASKTAADLLALAYHHTFGMDVVVTRCSNNYGRYQFPEKLIPLMTVNALHDRPMPVYGDGGNVRDWLHVEDHCTALLRVLEAGRAGEIYNIGGGAERTNLEIVTTVLKLLGKPQSLIRSSRTAWVTIGATPSIPRRSRPSWGGSPPGASRRDWRTRSSGTPSSASGGSGSPAAPTASTPRRPERRGSPPVQPPSSHAER